MKTRILWVAPSERDLKPGHVYELADGAALVAAGDAEAADKDAVAEPDPRPQPQAAEPDPAPAATDPVKPAATAKA